MGIWKDIVGTTGAFFKLGLAGVRLKNNSGNLAVRNSGDSADAELTASKVNVSGDGLDINSDAAGSGADWKYTIQRPASGMGAAVVLTLPVDDGTPNQVLQTDGSGVLTWASAASTSSADKCDTTTLAFNSSATVALFTTGASDIIDKIQVIVDTAFDGTNPAVSIGVAGTVSKYAASSQIDLANVGVYEINPGKVAGGAEALIATFAAGAGAAAGAARILVYFNTPA